MGHKNLQEQPKLKQIVGFNNTEMDTLYFYVFRQKREKMFNPNPHFYTTFLLFVPHASHCAPRHYAPSLPLSPVFPEEKAQMAVSTEHQPVILYKHVLNEPASM